MANKTDDISKKRAKKKVIREDIFNRYEVVGTNGILGEIFIPKDTDTLTSSNTVTLTVV